MYSTGGVVTKKEGIKKSELMSIKTHANEPPSMNRRPIVLGICRVMYFEWLNNLGKKLGDFLFGFGEIF